MGRILKPTVSKDFSADLAPAGTHAAVCVAVIELGTHTPEKGYMGAAPKPAFKLFVVWELVEEATRPTVWKDFTASLNEKAKLRTFLKNWRGRDIPDGENFDIAKIAGAKCLLTITHTKSGDRTFANVEAAAPPMKGMTIKDPDKTPFTFFFEDGEAYKGPAWEVPFWYGKSIEEAISESEEMAGAPDAEQMGDDADRDPVVAATGTTEEAPF